MNLTFRITGLAVLSLAVAAAFFSITSQPAGADTGTPIDAEPATAQIDLPDTSTPIDAEPATAQIDLPGKDAQSPIKHVDSIEMASVKPDAVPFNIPHFPSIKTIIQCAVEPTLPQCDPLAPAASAGSFPVPDELVWMCDTFSEILDCQPCGWAPECPAAEAREIVATSRDTDTAILVRVCGPTADHGFAGCFLAVLR